MVEYPLIFSRDKNIRQGRRWSQKTLPYRMCMAQFRWEYSPSSELDETSELLKPEQGTKWNYVEVHTFL